MNKLLRNFVGYRVNLCNVLRNKMYKNKIKKKGCFVENMNTECNFDILFDMIADLNNRLKYWLDDMDEGSKELFPRNIVLKSLKVESLEFFDAQELKELIGFDDKFSNDICLCTFEKEVLLKKKDYYLKNLEINTAILYVNLINEVDDRLTSLKESVLNTEKIFNEKYDYYLSTYNQFELDIVSASLKPEDLYNNANYTSNIVGLYRRNKIFDMIISHCDIDDIDTLFESMILKELLGNDYFLIKQKVNNYVGANS